VEYLIRPFDGQDRLKNEPRRSISIDLRASSFSNRGVVVVVEGDNGVHVLGGRVPVLLRVEEDDIALDSGEGEGRPRGLQGRRRRWRHRIRGWQTWNSSFM